MEKEPSLVEKKEESRDDRKRIRRRLDEMRERLKKKGHSKALGL